MSVRSIVMAAAGGVAPTDPSFANVQLLLHCDGTNGSTTFTDSSGSPKTVTPTGATISTAQSAFGGTSALIASTTGTSNKLTTSPTITLSGDYTLETWVYQTGASGGGYTILFTGSGNEQFGVDYSADGVLMVYVSGFIQSSAGVFARNGWHHVAYCRSGTMLRIFYDGTQVASGTHSGSFSIAAIGGYTSAGYTLLGYMDEIRITSSARYTGSFTPPSAAFPNA